MSSVNTHNPGTDADAEKPRVAFWNDPEKRGYLFQIVLFGLIGYLGYMAYDNMNANLVKQNIASGLGFWNNTAGFDIGQRLIPYETTSTYGRAFWVGLLNTLLVAGVGIVFATLLGFIVGVARLSRNWLVQKLATIYVEGIRNIPLLLQLLFWYNAVLKALPEVRDSIVFKAPLLRLWPELAMIFLPVVLLSGGIMIYRRSSGAERLSAGKISGILFALLGVFFVGFDFTAMTFEYASLGIFLNNRGMFVPDPVFGPTFPWVLATLIAGLIGYFFYGRWARIRQEKTGEQAPVLKVGFGLVIVLPLLVFFLVGKPLSFTYPDLGRFNIRGGVQVYPEFVALVLGLVIYTAAFIAEAVRAGIQAVSRGQTEAAYALGLRPGPTLDLVVIPQAMRVIIPPLTSHYLNLTKNSSLAVAIGYPDLVQVFTGTVLNQTGQAVEVVAITMVVYLTISLTTSLFMNWYNARKALVER